MDLIDKYKELSEKRSKLNPIWDREEYYKLTDEIMNVVDEIIGNFERKETNEEWNCKPIIRH